MYVGLVEFPGGEATALQQWTSLVGEDRRAQPSLCREVDRGQRSTDPTGRKRSGIAVRDDARVGRDQRDSMLADRQAHGAILSENLRSLSAESGTNRLRISLSSVG